jgi:hypothetical protein
LGPASKSVAHATQELVNATKTVIATTPQRDEQKAVIERAKALIAETQDLVSAARSVSAAPGDARVNKMMGESDTRVTTALTALVGNITGVDTEGVDKALAAVSQALTRFAPTKSAQPFAAAAEDLTAAAKVLQAASGQVRAISMRCDCTESVRVL